MISLFYRDKFQIAWLSADKLARFYVVIEIFHEKSPFSLCIITAKISLW